MDGNPDFVTPTSTDADDGLDPQAAAAILDQAGRQAKRAFDPNPPLKTLAAAAIALLAYGTIWLSVRGQHPYAGPTGWALAIMYALVAVIAVVAGTAASRARQGVTGRSAVLRRTEAATIVIVYVMVYVFMGALKHLGVSNAIVYGVYPAVAPLIIVGAAAAGLAAGKERWLELGTALPIVVVGACCAYAGPVGVWLAAGIGLFVVISARVAVSAWSRRG
jgi:hypothetical protein